MHELNQDVLFAALAQLPHLVGLHIVGCSRIDQAAVFRAFEHVPLLEALSFTAWVSRIRFDPASHAYSHST